MQITRNQNSTRIPAHCFTKNNKFSYLIATETLYCSCDICARVDPHWIHQQTLIGVHFLSYRTVLSGFLIRIEEAVFCTLPAPVTMVLPSGDTLMYTMRIVCPGIVAKHSRFGHFHSLIAFVLYPCVLMISLQFLDQ